MYSIHRLQYNINIFSFQLFNVNNILSCVSSVPEYNLLSTYELCSDQGMVVLTDIYDCKKAARALKLKDILNVPIFASQFPKGCFWTEYPDGEKKFISTNITLESETSSESQYAGQVSKPTCPDSLIIYISSINIVTTRY